MEPDNLTYGVKGPESTIPFTQIWNAMVDKIGNPGRYLPGVESVTCTPLPTTSSTSANDKTDDNGNGNGDGRGDGGVTSRSMKLANGRTMNEDIYAFKNTGRIEFRVHDRDLVVVNRWLREERCIEYLLENRAGQTLGWFDGMREGTRKAIAGQYKIAEEMVGGTLGE